MTLWPPFVEAERDPLVRFDENYGLASTQSLKNKDIPEGGAKGTILPAIGANPRLCFEKYVDVSLFPAYNAGDVNSS